MNRDKATAVVDQLNQWAVPAATDYDTPEPGAANRVGGSGDCTTRAWRRFESLSDRLAARVMALRLRAR